MRVLFANMLITSPVYGRTWSPGIEIRMFRDRDPRQGESSRFTGRGGEVVHKWEFVHRRLR
jgi:hypothetical protein